MAFETAAKTTATNDAWEVMKHPIPALMLSNANLRCVVVAIASAEYIQVHPSVQIGLYINRGVTW